MDITQQEKGLLTAIAEHPEDFKTYLESVGLLASFQAAMHAANQ